MSKRKLVGLMIAVMCVTGIAGADVPASAETEELYRCPSRIGNLQIISVRPSVRRPAPAFDGAGVLCEYQTKQGLVRLYADWAVRPGSLQWRVEVPAHLGCAKLSRRPEVQQSSIGWSILSAAFVAQAGITSESRAAIDEIIRSGWGEAQQMLIWAELRARPCN